MLLRNMALICAVPDTTCKIVLTSDVLLKSRTRTPGIEASPNAWGFVPGRLVYLSGKEMFLYFHNTGSCRNSRLYLFDAFIVRNKRNSIEIFRGR